MIDKVRFHLQEKIKFLEEEERVNEANKLEAKKWLELLDLITVDQTHYQSAEHLLRTEYERDKESMREAFAENLSDIINKWFDRDYRFSFRKIEKRGKNVYVLVDEKINKSTKKKRTGKLGLACGGGVGQSTAFISALILARSLGSEILILDESFSNVGVEAMESLIQVFPFHKDIQIITTEHYTNLLQFVDHKEITLGIRNNTTTVVKEEFIQGEEMSYVDEEIANIVSSEELILEDTVDVNGVIKNILKATGQVDIEDDGDTDIEEDNEDEGYIDDEFNYSIG